MRWNNMPRQSFKIILKPLREIYSFVDYSLKHKLVLSFFMISVLPIILIGSLIYQSTSQIMVERVTKSSTDLIMKKIGYFDEVFYEVNKMLLEATSSTDTIKFLNLDKGNIDLPESNQVLDRMASKYEYMLQLKGDFIDSIMILPRKGYFPFFRGLRIMNYVDDFSGLELYKKTIKSKSIVLWSFDGGTENEGYYITASSSVIDGLTNEVIGVFVVYLDISKIKGILEHSGNVEGEEVFVIDSNNTLIYHTDYRKIGKTYNNEALLKKMEGSSQGSFIKDINQKDFIVTHYTSTNSGWRIVNVVPYDNILKDVGVISFITVMISLGCLLYTLIIAILLYGNIYSPINGLMLSMNELGEGNLDIRINSRRRDELGKLSEGFNSMSGRIAVLIENIKLEQKLKKENEIKALQSQITPHFLYNTLNCVKTMIRADRKEDSENMITSLIGLLKISLTNTKEYVSIMEELNYAKSYIEIMEYRYEKKVSIIYDIDNSLLCCSILKFILQPIVENCFIHAFTDMDKEWSMKIVISRDGGNINVEIIDNGVGMNLDRKHSNGDVGNTGMEGRVKFSSIGLNNINERILLNYGEPYGMVITSKLGEGTNVRLHLPYIKM